VAGTDGPTASDDAVLAAAVVDSKGRLRLTASDALETTALHWGRGTADFADDAVVVIFCFGVTSFAAILSWPPPLVSPPLPVFSEVLREGESDRSATASNRGDRFLGVRVHELKKARSSMPGQLLAGRRRGREGPRVMQSTS